MNNVVLTSPIYFLENAEVVMLECSKLAVIRVILLTALVVFGFGLPAVAQSGGKASTSVRDLTDGPASRGSLVDVLTPDGDSPGASPRGWGARSLAAPDCSIYREGMARGVGVEPVSDVAAIRIEFDFDSAELAAESRDQLQELGAALQDPNLSPYCFLLEGHADHVGSEDYNQDLSERRAESVRRYLVSEMGVDEGRLLIRGYGESVPLVPGEDDDARRKNRRVQVANLGSARTP